MFTQTDSVSEVIAHFIGHFELAVEDARVRHELEKFRHEDDAITTGELPVTTTPFDPQLKLQSTDPSVNYRSESPPLKEVAARAIEQAKLPMIDIKPIDLNGAAGPFHASSFSPSGADFELGPRPGPMPGSVAHISVQQAWLFDDDVLVMPGGDFAGSFDAVDFGRFEMLRDMEASVGQELKALSLTDGGAGIAEFIEAAADIVATAETGETAEGSVTLTGEATAGIHVNGELQDEAPELEDFLPSHLDDEEDEDITVITVEAEGSAEVVLTPDGKSGSLELNAGGNASINEVAVVNAGMAPTFLAVMGDYHDFNAIVQVNIYSDWDITQISGGNSHGGSSGADATVAVNIAQFSLETRDVAGQAAEAKPDVLPSNWQVTVVAGDVTFLTWIDQYTFKSDNDIAVLTATGSTTTITSGENIGLNGVLFANIGQFYDLVIIGGSLYDANIICQTNVLYDDDAVSMLLGAGDEASVSTGGNLLWNEANIHNVGPAEWQTGIPSAYQDAADALASGNQQMPDSVADHQGFEGYGALRVLYISGNVYDLQYINQTNVICDADMVAALATEVVERQVEMEWKVDTGSNALINTATITDYDGVGAQAYVGGQVYSDAILIQAELVLPEGVDSAHPLQPLVSEAIVFLVDADAAVPVSEDIITPILSDAPPVDVMQSVLA